MQQADIDLQDFMDDLKLMHTQTVAVNPGLGGREKTEAFNLAFTVFASAVTRMIFTTLSRFHDADVGKILLHRFSFVLLVHGRRFC